MRTVAFITILTCILASTASAQTGKEKQPGSLQILDNSMTPSYEVDLAIISETTLEDFGDTTTAEFGGIWQVAYFQDVLQSDIDMKVGADLTLLTDSAGVSLPDQLGHLAFDSGAIWHYVNDSALEIRLKPEINTDLEDIGGDGFYFPMSAAVMKEFIPELSGVMGLELRPDYERLVMPIVALGWMPHERLHVKAGLPESRIMYYAAPEFTPYLGLNWNSITYSIHEDDALDRTELTLEDFRFFGGLRYRMTEEMQFVTELGEVFGRSFEFDREAAGLPRDLDAENSFFVRFALLGPF